MNNDLSDIEDQKLGQALAVLLNLKPNQDNRFDLVGGDKTKIGLARTIRRVYNDPQFVSELIGGSNADRNS